MKPVTLFQKDVTKNIRVWAIQYKDGQILIEYGIFGGAMQYQLEEVTEGKAGRTLEQQVDSRIRSRINKQLLKGYKYTLEEALREVVPGNQLLMPKPMLAQKRIPIPRDAYIQYKYDGNRCMIVKDGDDFFAYSRNGKKITSIPHVLESVCDIPDGTILDGELYIHGIPLQSIRSLIAREQTTTKELQYYCYDVVEQIPYRDRLALIKEFPFGEHAQVVPTWEAHKEGENFIQEMFQKARAEGYEGLIARNPNMGYEAGKRSKGLIKIKQFDSEEYTVIDVDQSRDGWGILVCRTHDHRVFKVSAPGTMSEKRDVWLNRANYIGKSITVEFANLTPDGIPFHPVAIAFREGKE